jgi:hypothetical protein
VIHPTGQWIITQDYVYDFMDSSPVLMYEINSMGCHMLRPHLHQEIGHEVILIDISGKMKSIIDILYPNT